MTNEQIIRAEAQAFYTSNIEGLAFSGIPAISTVKGIRTRLIDFYTPENKAFFLDEIQNLIKGDIFKYSTQSRINKTTIQFWDTLLFYINQEIENFPAIVHQLYKTKSGSLRNKVFVSYSHQDKEYLTDIKRHFKPFLNQIEFWDDSKIGAGKKWKDEITDAINATKVAIFLVSTDFLGSDFISREEVPPLLKAAEDDGAVILMLMLKPCLFDEFPQLNQYQALNPPSKPLMSMTELEKEEIYVSLVRQTKKHIDLN